VRTAPQSKDLLLLHKPQQWVPHPERSEGWEAINPPVSSRAKCAAAHEVEGPAFTIMRRKSFALRKIYLCTIAIAIALSGCRSLERSRTCAPIDHATRIIVSRSLQGKPTQDLVIIDPQRIHELTAFANARRKAHQPWDTMPAPNVTASFYDSENFLGSIGVGPNFFLVTCPRWRGIREGTKTEIGDFERLVGGAN